MKIEDCLSCSGRSECVLMWAKPGESGGLLVQSAHSSPLTLPCLSILFFPCSHALPLWGSTSINNTALSATPFPRCVCIYACTCACTRVICLLYTQRRQACMQTPCVQIQHFWTHTEAYVHCLLDFLCGSVYGGSVVWLITAAGVCSTPPFFFGFVLYPNILLHCSASCLSFIPVWKEHISSSLTHTAGYFSEGVHK